MNPVPLFLIIVTLIQLLGSLCHAELRTWTAVNGNKVEAEFVRIMNVFLSSINYNKKYNEYS